jgi:uncharacterized paraquat-inducible protein A
MLRHRSPKADGEMMECPRCKEPFLTYSLLSAPACPRCGKPVRTKQHQRIGRLVALVLVVALMAAGVVAFALTR